MKMLKSKLIEIKERAHLERIEGHQGEQKDIGSRQSDPLVCVHALHPGQRPPNWF